MWRFYCGNTDRLAVIIFVFFRTCTEHCWCNAFTLTASMWYVQRVSIELPDDNYSSWMGHTHTWLKLCPISIITTMPISHARTGKVVLLGYVEKHNGQWYKCHSLVNLHIVSTLTDINWLNYVHLVAFCSLSESKRFWTLLCVCCFCQQSAFGHRVFSQRSAAPRMGLRYPARCRLFAHWHSVDRQFALAFIFVLFCCWCWCWCGYCVCAVNECEWRSRRKRVKDGSETRSCVRLRFPVLLLVCDMVRRCCSSNNFSADWRTVEKLDASSATQEAIQLKCRLLEMWRTRDWNGMINVIG